LIGYLGNALYSFGKGYIVVKRFQDKKWKEEMKITFDYNHMMSEFVGDEGIEWSQLEALNQK
jgi:hypothetical protein